MQRIYDKLSISKFDLTPFHIEDENVKMVLSKRINELPMLDKKA